MNVKENTKYITPQVCVSTVLEKFKEKKSNVVTALRDCMDAMYPCLTLENMQEDLIEALNNKNPSIKAETCLFLGNTLPRCRRDCRYYIC